MTARGDGGRVLAAPDSFKGTHTAAEVAAAIARGARAAGAEAEELPLADGGEGTLEVLLDARGGEIRTARVTDPLGRPIDAHFGLLADGTAVVEVAEASGLTLVAEPERDAWAADSRGTGQLIAAASAAGAKRILVAAGGSATTDGGAGAIAALAGSARSGETKARTGPREISGLPPVAVLCDVATPFEHAARVFAPQKGADPATVARLDERLARLAATAPRDPRGVPMSGAAGGLAGGLWAYLSAELVPGAAYVCDTVGLDERAGTASLVISGEGRLDATSLEGKVVGEVASRCGRLRVPCAAIAGDVTADRSTLSELGLSDALTASSLTQIERAASALAGGESREAAPRG